MPIPTKTVRLAPLCLFLSLAAFASAQAATRPDFYAVFNPAAGQLPFPDNLLFAGSTDGALNIPVADPTNLADPKVAMNGLDGFSTVAPLTANFSATLNTATVKAGSTAPQAAGVIHTDFEKGFIRAETIGFDDFLRYRGEAGARDAGRMRLEGKEYRVQEGDVLHFRFNV